MIFVKKRAPRSREFVYPVNVAKVRVAAEQTELSRLDSLKIRVGYSGLVTCPSYSAWLKPGTF